MTTLDQNLLLPRCPHCAVARPNLFKQHHIETKDHAGHNHRFWAIYVCGQCGGVVTATASKLGGIVKDSFPESTSVADDIPDRARDYLQQALESLHAPAGAVMLSASAVDAMLKIKGYGAGTLYSRIEKAAEDHLITNDMAKWTHEVRLDANDQRHADDTAELPSTAVAQRTIDFALALAEILFSLPNRVTRGISEAKTDG
jgi:hypothetical protein